MQSINDVMSDISGFLWGWPMMILLLGTHIYLTIRLRFPQRKLWTAIQLSVKKDDKSKGDVSQFGALATSLAATIGTGNIIGVATAVSLGGPGAVFWCWITGVFGISTKYGEGLLAIKYRERRPSGRMLGGPMFALDKGLHAHWLAVLFSVFTAIAAFGIGNTVQANAISENIAILADGTFDPIYVRVVVGVAIATLVGLVIFGGIKSISNICTKFVPLMSLFYVLGCIYILCVNHQYIMEALRLIMSCAFSNQSIVGGAIGSTVMAAARFGIARGLFSNESGMGSAPIVAAAAQTRNPVRQALVSSTGTFWDTVVICAMTGLVIVTSILAYPEIDYQDGGLLTKEAFARIPIVGTPILTIGIITFAFSTILGWCYYGERAVEYLSSRRGVSIYRVFWIGAIVLGSIMSLGLVWNIADIMNALMAIPNLVSLLLLSNVITRETNYYLWGNRLDESSEELQENDNNDFPNPS
ncbi:MAG: sodium:alanine symporter family protein [Bacteroidaceae bacterium]|nr:sodium:alanine symporter family protein [Bacteroidaceae bacterium]